ncbi:hypothetical protein MNBD_ALPHA06-2011 [hydrothermal vent metagenome]|uniref:Uncharacterized protein n=1 Tax=hydrothermal vent metagenome TaxID=652676 RepID=A0A3B0SBQ6_9ZZZZ
MQSTNITPDELKRIAWILVDRHGSEAAQLAGFAIAEMQQQGDSPRIRAWQALAAVIQAALDGHISKTNPLTLH